MTRGVSSSLPLLGETALRAASTSCPSDGVLPVVKRETCAMLAELIAALKNTWTTAGELAIVEPSTGSEPITKACANATRGRDRAGNQLKASKKLKLRASVASRRNGRLLLA